MNIPSRARGLNVNGNSVCNVTVTHNRKPRAGAYACEAEVGGEGAAETQGRRGVGGEGEGERRARGARPTDGDVSGVGGEGAPRLEAPSGGFAGGYSETQEAVVGGEGDGRPQYLCTWREACEAADYVLEHFGDRKRDRGIWIWYCRRIGLDVFLDVADETISSWRQRELKWPVRAFQRHLIEAYTKGKGCAQ